MELPQLEKASLIAAIEGIEDLGDPVEGGQKKVYPCLVGGKKFALKIMFPAPRQGNADDVLGADDEALDAITARAEREFKILQACQSNQLVKAGPISLQRANVDGLDIIYFTEEWIEGRSLREIISAHGALPIEDVVLMGLQVSSAVEAVWNLKKIHRDIKPGNIMRRNGGDFVLLDLGLAFALDESSVTDTGKAPGTILYFSPEQFDLARKRQMDFRSDLFSLGVVMYESATALHPFWTPGMTAPELAVRILKVDPKPPTTLRNDIPPALEHLILRLMAKKPHLRYGTFDRLTAELGAV